MPQIYLRTELYEEIVSRGKRGDAVGEFVNRAVGTALVEEEKDNIYAGRPSVKEEEGGKSDDILQMAATGEISNKEALNLLDDISEGKDEKS